MIFFSKLRKRARVYLYRKLGNVLRRDRLGALLYQIREMALRCSATKDVSAEYPLISLAIAIQDESEIAYADALDSVFHQTYEQWELLICIIPKLSIKRQLIVWYFSSQFPAAKKIHVLNDHLMSDCRNQALAMAQGQYICFINAKDALDATALAQVISSCRGTPPATLAYSDEGWLSSDEENEKDIHYKPDWAPDTFRSFNYLSNLCLIRTEALRLSGGFCRDYEGAEQYDALLKLTEKDPLQRFVHVPKLLFCNGRPYYPDQPYRVAARRALAAHMSRMGWTGRIVDGSFPGSFQIKYGLLNEPLISIIIPNKDHVADLKNCVESIIARTTYKNYEILIIENNSVETCTEQYYQQLLQRYENKITLLRWENPFNFSAVNNWAAAQAKGDFFLFLNNDTEVITPDWLEQMLSYAQRPDVGVVGCALLYRDDTYQHAGFIFGIGIMGIHAHRRFPRSHMGYWGRLKIVQNLSAVTGACIMLKKSQFLAVGGFDEHYIIAVSDVDLCIKFRMLGKVNVYLPDVELYHDELKTRGDNDSPEKTSQFIKECEHFSNKWGKITQDPYYNVHLTSKKDDFSIKDEVIESE